MPDNRIMLDIDGLEKLLAKCTQSSQSTQQLRGVQAPQNAQGAKTPQNTLSPKELEKLQNIIGSLRAHKAQIDAMYKYAACAYAAYAGLNDYISGRFATFATIDSAQKDAPNIASNTALNTILTPAQLESFERLTPAQKALFTALIRRPNMKGDKIIIGGFSPRLWGEALAVARDFEVVKHINERCAESRGGFKATLFKDRSQSAPNAQSYVLAIAGTDAPNPNIFNDEIDIKDLCADVSLALKRLPHAQFESMINFYYRIKEEIFARIKGDARDSMGHRDSGDFWGAESGGFMDSRHAESKKAESISADFVDSKSLDSGILDSSVARQIRENLGARGLDSSNLDSRSIQNASANPRVSIISAIDCTTSAPINPAISLTIVGHSLGGYLAQIFALVFAEDISGVYTYQAPGQAIFIESF